jgi:trypsin-like peptidase
MRASLVVRLTAPRVWWDRMGLIVLATLSLWCASSPASWAGQPSPAEVALLRGSLRLVGRFASGHACPVEPRMALTNGHVVDMRPFDDSVRPFPYAWSDGTGASGFLVPAELERGRDLARVQPLNARDVFPHPFRVAAEAPKPGDRVWLLDYDWRNRKSAMADDVIEARVTRVVALHVMFIPSGLPGSSGSCLLNDAGEVVAINEGGYDTDAHEVAGLAVGVWGGLHRMPED